MLGNRRFAIPLIILLAFCFIGLILVGIVLILRPGAPADSTPVAQATATVALEATEEPSSTPEPVDSPTPRPTPTLVPMGTSVDSESTGTAASTAVSTAESSAGTAVSSSGTDEPTTEATAAEGAAEEATTTPDGEEQLADTGVGWGLILVSGVGLAILVLVSRRLRLAH
jgi:hypothetical protein